MNETYIHKIIENESRSKSNTKRLDVVDEKIEKLEDTYCLMKNMDYRMGQVENAVKSIDTNLQNSQEKKGMKWDKLIEYLFYAWMAYMLGQIGLK